MAAQVQNFAPVVQPVTTPLRRVYKRWQRWEARHHETLQELPHTLPLLAAVVCIALMVLPLQDSKEPPAIFQWSLLLTLLAAAGWFVVTLGNDYMHFRYGLLRPQKPRTVCLMLVVGVAFAAARITHLSLALPGYELTTEWLQRMVSGLPYFGFRFFGLDM